MGMEIRAVKELTPADWLELGNFGYRSIQKYELTTQEAQGSFSMHLSLIDLEAVYEKVEMNDEEDLARYQEMLQLGYSVGAYRDGGLIALVIAEPQHWNNTLMIWHVQVHKTYQRQGYGKLLIDQVNDMAQEKGFRATTIETQNTNVPAIHFYRHCGYQIEGIDISLYSNNRNHDDEVAIYMRRPLSRTK